MRHWKLKYKMPLFHKVMFILFLFFPFVSFADVLNLVQSPDPIPSTINENDVISISFDTDTYAPGCIADTASSFNFDLWDVTTDVSVVTITGNFPGYSPSFSDSFFNYLGSGNYNYTDTYDFRVNFDDGCYTYFFLNDFTIEAPVIPEVIVSDIGSSTISYIDNPNQDIFNLFLLFMISVASVMGLLFAVTKK